MEWFTVDKEGLSRVLERKGKAFAIYELIQNALDEQTTRIDVTLERIAGSKHALLVVSDDAPEGFEDLSHAFTLFARSKKGGEASQRGRFNAGEKMTLALCSKAEIRSTTGTVIFDEKGRRRTGAKTQRGSVFTGHIRMTTEEISECEVAVRRLLVPEGVCLVFNGQMIRSRRPIRTVEASLPTEIADAEGFLRRATRLTTVEVYEPLDGEEGSIFEMGIPITVTGDRYHVNVKQKVPLPMDRDSVPPAYLAKVRAVVLEAMAADLAADDANSAWVKDAVQRHGGDLGEGTVDRLAALRFGEKRVAFDPSDTEANHIAVMQGYQLVYGSQLTRQEWDVMRKAGAILPAGKVTPSPKPFSPDGEPLKMLEPSKWTERMTAVVAYARRLAPRLIGVEIDVVITSTVTWPFAAAYGSRRLVLNLGRLGHRWFEGDLEAINDLLLHELAHEACLDHLSSKYHEALTRLGARMTGLALTDPALFRL